MLCFNKRSLQKKKYSNSKIREENIIVVYYSLRATIVSLRSFSPFLLEATVGVDESWLLTDAWQIGRSRLGRRGRGLGTSDVPVLKAAFNSPKISWLVLFIERLWETNRRSPNVRCHQWNCREALDNSSVIILKSRLTFPVLLPARASFVTPRWLTTDDALARFRRQCPSVILHFVGKFFKLVLGYEPVPRISIKL